MSIFKRKALLIGAGVAALGFASAALLAHAKPTPPAKAATSETKQVVTGPVAEYWISTTTSSGMSLSGLSGGGGKPSMSSIMNMMKGGTSHTMRLQLGSRQDASGDPAADHLPPAALDAGNDLPLYYKAPVTQKETYTPTESHEETRQSEPPKGKILIFWGCGEHAPAGQPVVIDLSKLADSSARISQMSKMMPTPVALDAVHPPSPQNWKTYGEWPNEKSRDGLKSDSSLLGAHTIKGNYSPQINFSLDQSQDFLPPIDITGNTRDAQGAVPLTWTQIPGAKGFIATAFGGGGENSDGGSTIVMWTSAQMQMGWMGLGADYLTAHDIERLLQNKTLLPGDATTCTVPAEVANAGKGVMYGLTAYGGETNMAYPSRPTDPKVAWNIQWETKIRYKSTTGGMLGQSMGRGGGFGSMAGGGDDNSGSAGASSSSDAPKEKKKKPSLLDLAKQGASLLGH